MDQFPRKAWGKIIDYTDDQLKMPTKIIEMGLLPGTAFRIVHLAPFGGPMYIEFGPELSRIALRRKEASYILVN